MLAVQSACNTAGLYLAQRAQTFCQEGAQQVQHSLRAGGLIGACQGS